MKIEDIIVDLFIIVFGVSEILLIIATIILERLVKKESDAEKILNMLCRQFVISGALISSAIVLSLTAFVIKHSVIMGVVVIIPGLVESLHFGKIKNKIM